MKEKLVFDMYLSFGRTDKSELFSAREQQTGLLQFRQEKKSNVTRIKARKPATKLGNL
jgi:hypothetical protein